MPEPELRSSKTRTVRRSSTESFEPLLAAGQAPQATIDAAAKVTGEVERVLSSLMLVLLQHVSHERGFGAIDAPGFLLQPDQQTVRQLQSERFHRVMVRHIRQKRNTCRAVASSPVPVRWTDAFREAEDLGKAHTETLGIRGVDLLHAGIALALWERSGSSRSTCARLNSPRRLV